MTKTTVRLGNFKTISLRLLMKEISYVFSITLQLGNSATTEFIS